MFELLLLLLPVAAASGWFLAKRSFQKQTVMQSGISPEYFKGINYFLNEQPDKAIEVFIKMLEVNCDTVEPHLALGNLFRRRGEVDRAIRIHQNLIARPLLSREQRAQALFELGQDYLKAGLLDRAESLFKELVEQDVDDQTIPALRMLTSIYEQEKEWENAIAIAQKLEARSGKSCKDIIAQYYCELAERAIKADDSFQARNALKKAIACDPDCVRASILQAEMAIAKADYKTAIKIYKKVESQDADYLSEILGPLLDCYRELGKSVDKEDYLKQILSTQKAVKPVLVFADYIRREQGNASAADFLVQHLEQHPTLTGLQQLIELELEKDRNTGESDSGQSNSERNTLVEVRNIMDRLLSKKPLYFCHHCGFSARTMHWQCPSCKYWTCIKPFPADEMVAVANNKH